MQNPEAHKTDGRKLKDKTLLIAILVCLTSPYAGHGRLDPDRWLLANAAAEEDDERRYDQYEGDEHGVDRRDPPLNLLLRLHHGVAGVGPSLVLLSVLMVCILLSRRWLQSCTALLSCFFFKVDAKLLTLVSFF